MQGLQGGRHRDEAVVVERHSHFIRHPKVEAEFELVSSLNKCLAIGWAFFCAGGKSTTKGGVTDDLSSKQHNAIHSAQFRAKNQNSTQPKRWTRLRGTNAIHLTLTAGT